MIRQEDLELEIGRASHGGDYLRLIHVPTGIQRFHPGPIKNVNTHQLIQNWTDEIEAELETSRSRRPPKS